MLEPLEGGEVHFNLELCDWYKPSGSKQFQNATDLTYLWSLNASHTSSYCNKAFATYIHACSRSLGTNRYILFTVHLKNDHVHAQHWLVTQLCDVFQEIDGDALLLLKSEMMMKYLGLKLGPALKLCYHIDRLKQNRLWFAAEEPNPWSPPINLNHTRTFSTISNRSLTTFGSKLCT